MARADGGKRIFLTKEDHEGFLFRLEKVCASCGWKVHAWVLMNNHFHLLLETPEANLSSGMRILLGTFSQGWNSRHQRRGHVFQGRYKSVPVSGELSGDAHYFKAVADYIHLNPARAGLAGGNKGDLTNFPWSSLAHYANGKAPQWMELNRVLSAFHLSHDHRGRAAYVAWLEARAANHGGKVDAESMRALRKGWYLGEEGFKDRLLRLVDQAKIKILKPGNHTGGAVRAHNECEAERILQSMALTLALPTTLDELSMMKKGHSSKVFCAALIKRNTAVSNEWIAKRLAMGHSSSVSNLVGRLCKQPDTLKILTEYEQICKSKD